MSQYKESLVVFTFIDNTDIFEGDLTKTEITIEEIYISMQKAIDRRQGRLKATGGAIIPDKSLVYPNSFTWYYQDD